MVSLKSSPPASTSCSFFFWRQKAPCSPIPTHATSDLGRAHRAFCTAPGPAARPWTVDCGPSPHDVRGSVAGRHLFLARSCLRSRIQSFVSFLLRLARRCCMGRRPIVDFLHHAARRIISHASCITSRPARASPHLSCSPSAQLLSTLSPKAITCSASASPLPRTSCIDFSLPQSPLLNLLCWLSSFVPWASSRQRSRGELEAYPSQGRNGCTRGVFDPSV
ncbi:hypothetical protein K402DRAFT_88653 [Aulographum hederae CBS 113979]|uniref:Uncharacterized protein n=1 Tax=Aulographum hederae CBS 113979 TaxID=1176131 RepID=A0A6G1H038_9PEZI|nr:hypothetical protein K402DRAFT_88653 [Aulographum hederae CBS 113979]